MNKDFKNLNTTALAFMGDAVYEVYVRRMLLQKDVVKADILHRKATRYVSAKAQAKGVDELLKSSYFVEEEADIYRRAKNHKISSKPKNVEPMTYKMATGFEAVIGYLFMTEQIDRMEEVIFETLRVLEMLEGKNESSR